MKLKKGSKRQKLRQRYKIKKKIKEANRKAKRDARRNPKRRSKRERDFVIPNAFPGKEEMLQKLQERKDRIRREKVEAAAAEEAQLQEIIERDAEKPKE